MKPLVTTALCSLLFSSLMRTLPSQIGSGTALQFLRIQPDTSSISVTVDYDVNARPRVSHRMEGPLPEEVREMFGPRRR